MWMGREMGLGLLWVLLLLLLLGWMGTGGVHGIGIRGVHAAVRRKGRGRDGWRHWMGDMRLDFDDGGSP